MCKGCELIGCCGSECHCNYRCYSCRKAKYPTCNEGWTAGRDGKYGPRIKYICLDCRHGWKNKHRLQEYAHPDLNKNDVSLWKMDDKGKCPCCGNQGIVVGPAFRFPSKSKKKAWEELRKLARSKDLVMDFLGT